MVVLSSKSYRFLHLLVFPLEDREDPGECRCRAIAFEGTENTHASADQETMPKLSNDMETERRHSQIIQDSRHGTRRSKLTQHQSLHQLWHLFYWQCHT